MLDMYSEAENLQEAGGPLFDEGAEPPAIEGCQWVK